MSPKIFSTEDKGTREQVILNCAKDMIRNEGEAALTIDKLVKKIPYSKGTVYNHFNSKEDIILALYNAHVEEIASIFTRALTFNGNNREKALAMHVGSLLNTKAYPQDFMTCVTVKTAGCTAKASELRRQQQQQLETALLSPVFAHYQTSVDAGLSVFLVYQNLLNNERIGILKNIQPTKNESAPHQQLITAYDIYQD